MAIRAGSLRPGDLVSIDQYQSSFPGRLPDSKGKEPKKNQYTGGTLFVDSALGLVHLSHQVSLKVGETLRAKKTFEQFARESGVTVKGYRADNVPFGTQDFRQDIKQCGQTIDFSGVGAHHQNGVAERAIGTITRLARTMLLQHAILWPERADLKLWPFAMDHAIYLWNNLPKEDGALSPIEVFTGVKTDNYEHIAHSHVWGCPVYVLDPKLQDGKKLPKWEPRARRGMYLGVSSQHSTSTIARVLNLRTGHISPQFHMVFDDKFSTINNQESSGLVDPARFDADSWERLVESGYELYLDPEEQDRPDLDDSWLTPNERTIRQERHRNRLAERTSDQVIVPLPEAVGQGLEGASNDTTSRAPLIDITSRDNIEQQATVSEDDVQQPSTTQTRSGRIIRPPSNMRANRFGEWANYAQAHYSKKVRTGVQDAAFLQGLKWTEFVDQLRNGAVGSLGSVMSRMVHDYDEGTLEEWDPMVMAVKADAASSADNPTWEKAMNGPDRDGYYKAAQIELDTLESMDTWEVVPQESWMNILPTTWAFKCKRYPDGTIRNAKG